MKNCRLCNSTLDAPFLALGSQPLSNSYRAASELATMEPHFPLDLYKCPTCHLVQLDEFEKATTIFSNDYAYFSSYSDSWLHHCKMYTEDIIKRFSINEKWKILEIASNDGYLLQYFKNHHLSVLGIEPAGKAAQMAIAKGIPTEIEYFTKSFSEKLVHKYGPAHLIIGNNVLAHNPDCNNFVSGIKVLLAKNGIVTMEFPHILSLLKNNLFDTIYHEHFSYFGFLTVVKLFQQHDMTIFDVEELETHGGSLRIYASHNHSPHEITKDKIEYFTDRELLFGLHTTTPYLNFKESVYKTKRDILTFLISQKNCGKKVLGYGAPAKGNTLINFCGIRDDLLEFTVDRNPSKQNMFLPGSHIPIFSPKRLAIEKPDFVWILPWNLKSEIMEQLDFIKEWGGKFVTALPTLEIL